MVNATRSECLNCTVEAFDVAQLQYADVSAHGFPNEVDVIIVADVMYYISWGGWPPIGNRFYPSFMVSGYQTRFLQHLTRRARKEVLCGVVERDICEELGTARRILFGLLPPTVGMLSRSSAESATEKAVTGTDSLVPASAAANAQAAATNASAYVISAASNSLSGLTPLISSVAAAMLSPEHEGKTFHDSCPEGYCTTGGTDGGHAGNGGVSAHGAGEVRGGKRVVKFSTHTGHHPRS
ncbi:unnamed protein product [Polarella glacialis]|uniref:Uncharacterized protein n=1 Tax=Polarella glacialis TaxID=89957 RepID=A0A813K6D8_POLGL|nr:unnamed protein product [Polarella glacialis]